MKGEINGKNPTISVAGQELRVVEQHKHMGSLCTPSGAMGPGFVESGSHAGSVFCGGGAFLRCGEVQPEVQEECGCPPGDAPPLQQ